MSGSSRVMPSLATPSSLKKGTIGWNVYWICAEVFLFIAFISGFYGLMHKNQDYGDEQNLLKGGTDNDTLVLAVKSLIITSDQVRICGVVALVCTIISFIMVTIMARVLGIGTP